MLRFGLLGTLTFLGLFIYFYKTSGKFRKSIIAAFAAATFFFSGLTTARAAGEADAFTPQPQHQSRPSHRSGFFSGRSSNDGSGPGKPDDFGSDSDRDGLPQFPQTESVEKTEERVERIDDHLRQMSEVSDSGTESESEDDFAEYPSAVTVKEALELPDIRTYEEAKKYAETNVPERLNVNEQHHISGLMAAKKTPHAPEIGLNPVDYGMKAEHVTLIRGMGLYQYLQKGYPLPPSSFLKDYQHLLKDICLEPQTRLLSDKSYTHNCKTPISIYENQNMSKSGKSSTIVQWIAEVWVADEVFNYFEPFLFMDYFKQKKMTIDEFSVLFHIIQKFSVTNLRKDFDIPRFFDSYSSKLNGTRKKNIKNFFLHYIKDLQQEGKIKEQVLFPLHSESNPKRLIKISDLNVEHLIEPFAVFEVLQISFVK